MRRRIYVAIGSLFVGCAFIGIFVPGWPTVSWMVPAAYLFSISDEAFFRWTLTNRFVGAKVFDYYAAGKTLPRHAKSGIIAFITIMSMISIHITTLAGDPDMGRLPSQLSGQSVSGGLRKECLRGLEFTADVEWW